MSNAAVAAAEKFVEEFYAEKPAGNTEEAPAENSEQAAVKPTEEVQETKAEETPAETGDANSETWQHKYDVLNGKFKKEVPVLHNKVKELEAKLQEVMSAQAAPQTQKQAEQTEEKQTQLAAAYAKLEEEYGKEFVEHSRALARMEAEELLKPILAKVESASSVSNQLAEERYIKDLTDRAPNWQKTKDNPEFHAWLAEVDPFSGMRRYDLAKDAMQRGDSARVAAFYNAFEPAKNQQRQATPRPMPDKNKLVTPTPQPTGGVQRTETNEAQYIKSSDLAKFARDVIAGRYAGRADEMKAIQAKYDAAQAAGRIVMD